MLLRIITIISLLLLASVSLIAQSSLVSGSASGQISGQVRYAEGGQPAFNVIVTCDSVNGGLIGQEYTDRNGRFRFSNLPLAQYTITVRVAGYVEERQTVELQTAPSANLQFQLKTEKNSRQPVNSGAGVTEANIPAAAKSEFNQATTLLASGKKEEIESATRHLEKAVAIAPQYLEAQLQLGAAYMDLQNWGKAEQTLQKTIEIDPKAANAYFALGELYLQQKKYDQAEKVLRDGLVIESRSARAHLALARVYWDKVADIKEEEKWRPPLEKSYDEVKQALALDPNLAGAHLLKGNLLFKVRRAEDALHEYEEYLRLDPKGPASEQIRQRVDRIKKALAETKKS